MAYSTSTPPALIVGAFSDKTQFWTYESTHTAAEVTTAAGFFTNGKALGMKLGDRVFGITTAYARYDGVVSEVSTTGVTLTS